MIIINKDTVRHESPCKSCGSVTTKFAPGKAHHTAELRCKDCEAHKGWLSQCDADIFKYALNKITERAAAKKAGREEGISKWKASQ